MPPKSRFIVRCSAGHYYDVLRDTSGATATFATEEEAAAEAARMNGAPNALYRYWAAPEYVDVDDLILRSLPRGEDR